MSRRMNLKRSGTGKSDNVSVASSIGEVGGTESSAVGRKRQKSLKKIKAKTILGFLSKKGKRKRALKKKASQRTVISTASEKATSLPPSTTESTNEPTSSNEPDLEDEDETVYGVSIDNNSIMNLATVNALPEQEPDRRGESFGSTEDLGNKPVEIILLLMDPHSRRFELLQLEFDASKAIVRDVISQISFSATEETLREQKYSAVKFPGGNRIESDDELLSKYCEGGEVLVAVPEGMDSASCERISKPILNDPNIVLLLGNVNNPLGNGEQETVKQPTQEEENESSESEQICEEEDQSFKNILPDKISPPETISAGEPTTPKASTNSESSVATSLKLLVLLISIMLPMTWKYHELVTASLSPGQVISPGERRSKCGVLSKLPQSYNDCTPAYIEMDHSGVLRVFNNEKLEVVKMTGGTCDLKKSRKGNKLCVLGAVVQNNGRLLIGGVSPTISGDKNFSLTPWPFTQKIRK